jgi:hypothetical protein
MPTYHVGPKDLGKQLETFAKRDFENLVEAIRVTVKVHGPRVVQQLISQESPKPVDRGTYRRSFQVDDIPGGSVLYNFAPHAAIIEEGRRPGARMPPVGAIYDWVKRKRIGNAIHGPVQTFAGPRRQGKGNRSDRQQAITANQMHIALMIARKIAARGLPAKRILARAEKILTPLVAKRIDQVLGKE